MQSLRKILVAALDSDIGELSNVISSLTVKGNTGEFKETLALLSAEQHEQLFSKLLQIARKDIIQLKLDDDDDEDGNLNDIVPAENEEENVARLRNVANIASIYAFELPHIRPPSFLETVTALHGTLIPLDECIPGTMQLKVAVSRICEHCWVSEEPGAENLVPQLLPYLLISSLVPDAFDNDIKRVFNVRQALLLLDFDDESIGSMKGLLLRCFLHPTYLKVPEGRRFLAFLFSVSKGLHPLILGVMKPQLATGIKSIADAYGEILYRAWKEVAATGEIISMSAIEDCLQGLVHDAIHAADPKYFRGLHRALTTLHEAKRHKGVDSMLLRIYGPILFRSLRFANGVVRSHAAALFFDSFPLQNEDATASEIDEILQKQFDLFVELLKDTDHRVRAVAAEGVCKVLKVFWEVLPAATKHACLTYIVGTLGQDASCSGVRLAVVNSLNLLMDQPLSHSVMEKLLPLMAHTIHDNTEKVRVAFVHLLIKIKSTRGILFYDIVPVEHLFYRMSEDQDKPQMCTAMTELLQESLFPQAEDLESEGMDRAAVDAEQVQRCLRLLNSHATAAECFYSHAHKAVGEKAVTKLAALLFALVAGTSENQHEEPVSKQSKKPQKRSRATSSVPEVTATSETSGVAGGVMDSTMSLQVLTVVEAIINSVYRKLQSKSKAMLTSIRLLSAVITHEATNKLIGTLLTATDSPALEATTVVIRLQALVDSLQDGPAVSTTSNLSLANKVLDSFVMNWNTLLNEEEEEAGATQDLPRRKQQLATTIITAITAISQQELLFQEISNCFSEFTKFPSDESAPKKKKLGNGKHSLSKIPFAAAVELLSSIVECGSSSAITSSSSFEVSTVTEEFIAAMKDVIASTVKRNLLILQSQDTWDSIHSANQTTDNSAMVRLVHLWASIAMHEDLRQMLKSTAPERVSSICNVIVFASSLLSRIHSNWESLSSSAGMTRILGECLQQCTVILSVVSDGLMLKCISEDILSAMHTMNDNIASVLRLVIHSPSVDELGLTLTAMLSVIARIASILTSKVLPSLTASNSMTLVISIVEILTIPLERDSIAPAARTQLAKAMNVLCGINSLTENPQFKSCMDCVARYIISGLQEAQEIVNSTPQETENTTTEGCDDTNILLLNRVASGAAKPTKELIDGLLHNEAAIATLKSMDKYIMQPANTNTHTHHDAKDVVLAWCNHIIDANKIAPSPVIQEELKSLAAVVKSHCASDPSEKPLTMKSRGINKDTTHEARQDSLRMEL